MHHLKKWICMIAAARKSRPAPRTEEEAPAERQGDGTAE